MVAGDYATRIPQARCEGKIERIARIDFIDRHQCALAHFARHHGVWARLGKYQAERDRRFLHRQARELRGDDLMPRWRRLVSSNVLRVICAAPHKKAAGVALTSPAALSHNKSGRE